MRETCLFCTSKHLSKAEVLMSEVMLGYTEHIWLVTGNLSEAEDECQSQYPKLAAKIRKVRLALMGQEGIFEHGSIMKLLREARRLAAIKNGISEAERVRRIIYPNLDANSLAKVRQNLRDVPAR